MGTITSVFCPSCGYQQDDLGGVGGDVGMLGALVVTVVCTKNAQLVDTNARSYIDPDRLLPDGRRIVWVGE